MHDEMTKEMCIQKYKECKQSNNGSIPELSVFLEYCGIPKRKLERIFGSSAYTKLQIASGDAPNKLELKRKPLETILEQFGKLALEIGAIPTGTDWEHRGFRPTVSGLNKDPHNLRWSELPQKFLDWIQTNHVSGFENVARLINESSQRMAIKHGAKELRVNN